MVSQYAMDQYEGQDSYQRVMEEESARRDSQDLFQRPDMTQVIKTFLDEDMPTQWRVHPVYKDFWASMGKTIKLTFLQDDDLIDFEMLFDDSYATYMMSKPAYEFTESEMMFLTQLRTYYLATLKRSIGFKEHRMNERTAQAGTTTQIVRTNTEGFRGGGDGGGGVFGKVKGWFV